MKLIVSQFWTVLYLIRLRRSSEPPQLSAKSPIRIYFHSHGEFVARHPLSTVIISVLAFLALSYPIPFLYGQTNGPSSNTASISNHVWTTARPFRSYTHEPDIEIRQAWIQGSYMSALKEPILKTALHVQEYLLEDSSSCSTEAGPLNRPSNKSGVRSGTPEMFFHSPLLYWNCSLSNIKGDQNLLETVNDSQGRHSAMNMSLRWGSVLAGKSFVQNRLVEADALVITMFCKPGSHAGHDWEQRAIKLSIEAHDQKFDIFPKNGKVENHRQYEFVYQPMNRLDIFLVVMCYTLALFYLLFYLRKMSAIRSRFGLFCTVLLQMAASVMSSFTILAIIKVPVSHIPREFFPFVVIVIGLENIFRLINAVFETPPAMSVPSRIATAVGKVGFLSSVAVAMDLFVLLVVAQFSFPAVREICAFAAVAIILDFIFHLTFFVAILSVEIRRLELNDILERFDTKTAQKSHDRRASLTQGLTNKASDILLGTGSTPFSTRLAGTAIMICFVFALNYHFFENETSLATMYRWFEMTRNYGSHDRTTMPLFPQNQARTPTAWLRRQDQLTGMELIRAIKPGAGRIIAKVYDPLFFVVKGSNRSKSSHSNTRLNALFDFDIAKIKAQILPFLFIAVTVSALITLVLNKWLGKNIKDDQEDAVLSDKLVSDDSLPPVSCTTLSGGHMLDIVLAAASKNGVVASVGLDRSIVVWKLRPLTQKYKREVLRPTCEEHILWPVLSLAVDDEGEWIVLAARSGLTSVWNVRESCFAKSYDIQYNEQRPVGFFFVPRSGSLDGYHFIIVKRSGLLLDVSLRNGNVTEHQVSEECDMVVSHPMQTPKYPFRVVSISSTGRIFISTNSNGLWQTEERILPSIEPPVATASKDHLLTFPLSSLGLMVFSRGCQIGVKDLKTGREMLQLQTAQFKPSSLRAFHSKRHICTDCNATAVSSLSIAYTATGSKKFIMHTFSSSKSKRRRLCIRPSSQSEEDTCLSIEEVTDDSHWVPNVTGWDCTGLNSVIGLRRRAQPRLTKRKIETKGSAGLRKRRGPKMGTIESDGEEWEIWTMEFDGKFESYSSEDFRDRAQLSTDRTTELLVSKVGPVTKISSRTIAISISNTIRILTLGVERFDDDIHDDEDSISHTSKFMRKRTQRLGVNI